MEPAIQKPTERHVPRPTSRPTPPAAQVIPVEARAVPRLGAVKDHADLDPRRPELARRVLNVVVALALIVATLPIMLVIAVLVKVTSRGPAIYKQTRVGLDRRASRAPKKDSRRAHDIGGLPFTIYKFRTMRVDAEKESGAVWASNDDARVTPVGRILRQFRLDELPQLFNILRGDMNLVGPRPERPELFEKLRKEIPDYQRRQLARPGLTGWAQVNQSYDTNIDDVRRKVQYDIEYIRRRGLAEDVKIMLRTVPVILFRRGGW